MKVKKAFPPNYKTITKFFPHVSQNPYAIFAYGNTIYSPSSKHVPEDLIVHESVHAKQQGDDPIAWWNKYLIETDFRLSQEVEAYRAQYEFASQKTKDKNAVSHFLHTLSIALSSHLYGNMVSYSKAKLLLCQEESAV